MAAKRPCPLCGAQIPVDAYYCKHCKQNLPAADVTPAGATPAAPVSAVKRGDWYCLQCGQFGAPKTMTKGSIFIEIFLWLM